MAKKTVGRQWRWSMLDYRENSEETENAASTSDGFRTEKQSVVTLSRPKKLVVLLSKADGIHIHALKMYSIYYLSNLLFGFLAFKLTFQSF